MKTGIIGALDVEVEHLVRELENCTSQKLMGMTFHEGLLHGMPVVVVMCGIGKVNAALCASVLINCYGVSAVINTGIAGSLDSNIEIGDLVVSTDAVHHDMDMTPLGFAAGQVPYIGTLAFPADEGLRSAVLQAAQELDLGVTVFEGRIASGDQFVSTTERKDWVVSTFDALCCEMEGAAIAHACYLARVPFVIVRAISDKADGSAEVDYPIFKPEAARRCASIVEKCLANEEMISM